MAGFETILKAADLIADVRKAFAKIENLEQGQRHLSDAIAMLDKRVREAEASLREARAEIRLDAVKEAQAVVNGVQGQLYSELRQFAVQVDRLSPTVPPVGKGGATRQVPPPPDGDVDGSN